MANNDKDYSQLSENLFQAIDIIYQERMKGMQFNKTVKVSITDISNAAKGEYIVSDVSSTFTSYSEITTYQIGNYVYVLIPNGDYNQQKSIIGRYVTADSEYYNYVKPSESFVNISFNLSKASLLSESREIDSATLPTTVLSTVPSDFNPTVW